MHMLEACMRHFQRQWAWRQEENQSESIDHCVDNSATDVINAVKLSRNKMGKIQQRLKNLMTSMNMIQIIQMGKNC